MKILLQGAEEMNSSLGLKEIYTEAGLTKACPLAIKRFAKPKQCPSAMRFT